jgi:hypothetical protein
MLDLLPVSYMYLILLYCFYIFGVINNPFNNLLHTVFNDGNMGECTCVFYLMMVGWNNQNIL